jgi:hypothetical protein
MSPQSVFHFRSRFCNKIAHETGKETETISKYLVAAAFFIDFSLSGQCLDGTGIDAAQTVIAGIFIQGVIGFKIRRGHQACKADGGSKFFCHQQTVFSIRSQARSYPNKIISWLRFDFDK